MMSGIPVRRSFFLFVGVLFVCSSSFGYRRQSEDHGGQVTFTAANRSIDPSPAPVTETTKSGHVFTRDRSHPNLGEAWRDPSGMIWGALVKKKDGSAHEMSHGNAVEYCRKIGAELPSEADFIRLRGYLGGRPGFEHEYSPQILPDLGALSNGRYVSEQFWSSSFRPRSSQQVAYFYGLTGAIAYDYRSRWRGYARAVRCVVRVNP